MNAAPSDSLAKLDPDARLLLLLLREKGNFVSGHTFTDALGVSRVAVWGRLEKLREQGIGIEAQRHQGYRLTDEPEHLHHRLLEAYAYQLGVRADLYFHESIDSTNSEAERLLASAAEAPFVVVSTEQTAGRGRMGRRWHSPDRGNLYASFAFRPEVPPRDLSVITLCFGLSLARVLSAEIEAPVRIKWPNDLLIAGRKVSGMLTEARIDADRTRDLVFGVGLNIAAETNSWPEEVQRMATTLRQHAARPLSVNHTAALAIRTVLQTAARFFSGARGELLADWNQFDALHGETIETTWRGERIQGAANGIDAEGRLRLRRSDGTEIAVHAGEVTIGSGPKKTG